MKNYYFAIDKNFKIIKKYNNSDYYALIVGDLANKIKMYTNDLI